ncbi:MAG: extracellular solute-binding protein [Clostridiales bacterium]|nr:extracellular solute-binding protein [Clostridiales bacterium]
MKKVIALVLALCMALALCACSSKPAASTSAKKTITMWCIATESDANRPAYEQAIENLKTTHPDVDFQWEATENEAYKTKIKAAVSANEMPDIFFTWAGAFLGDFVSAGRVYCLDEAYKPFASELPEAMLANGTYNGGHYAVPLTMNVVTLFANMDLLAQAGYTEIPGTYDELMACCDALVAKGIIPFGCSGKEPWCVTEYVEPMIEKAIGAEELSKIFAGQSTWNNPDIADAVNKFQEMINKGYFDPDGIALGNDEVKANFLAGKYAFYQNGSWNCGEADAALGDKVKVTEFPVINPGKATLGQLIGGPSDSLAVAASSSDPALAAQIAFELGRDICFVGYTVAGSGLPAWSLDYSKATINAATAGVADMAAKATGYVLFGDTAMPADRAGTYLDYIGQVYGCAINGEQFVEGLTASLG